MHRHYVKRLDPTAFQVPKNDAVDVCSTMPSIAYHNFIHPAGKGSCSVQDYIRSHRGDPDDCGDKQDLVKKASEMRDKAKREVKPVTTSASTHCLLIGCRPLVYLH